MMGHEWCFHVAEGFIGFCHHRRHLALFLTTTRELGEPRGGRFLTARAAKDGCRHFVIGTHVSTRTEGIVSRLIENDIESLAIAEANATFTSLRCAWHT